MSARVNFVAILEHIFVHLRNVLPLLLFPLSLLSIHCQIPAPPQGLPIYLVGGTIHTGDGNVIENGVIGFRDGKITLVTSRANFDEKAVSGEILDVSGKQIYPGLIALNTSLGLREIDAVRATRDDREVGELNPNVRAIIAYNVDSKIIPTVRSNGILLAQIVPRGSVVPGLSSVVQLDAWTWEDAAIATDNGLHVIWPLFSSAERQRYGGTGKAHHSNRDLAQRRLAKIRKLFDDAQQYCQSTAPHRKNLKLEAICSVLSGKRKLFVHTNDAKGILSAIAFFQQYGLRPIIVGGAQSDLVLDILQRDSIPIILTGVHRLPPQADAPVDHAYRLPAVLAANHILFAIAAPGSWMQRNLPFHVGTAIAYGLPYEEGVKAVTANAAKILGIDHRCGMLKPGYDATLIVCSGDLFNPTTSTVEMAFIQGRRIDLDNLHKQLYRKYLIRYGLRPR